MLRVGNKPQPAWSVSTMWKPARSCFVDFNKLPTIIKLTLWKKGPCSTTQPWCCTICFGHSGKPSLKLENRKGRRCDSKFILFNCSFPSYWLFLPFFKNGDGKKVNAVRENCIRFPVVYITDGCTTIQPDTMTLLTLCLYSRHVADAFSPTLICSE